MTNWYATYIVGIVMFITAIIWVMNLITMSVPSCDPTLITGC